MISRISRDRVDAVDIAKGLGILLVYIGHVPPSKFVVRFIYNFHMPLFFFLTGLFLDEKKYNFKEFVLSRCKTLMIPFVTFILFAILLHYIPEFDLLHPSMGNIGGAALWFLPVLFVAEIIIYSCWKITDSIIARAFICLFFFLVALVVDRMGVRIYFSLQSIPMAAGFVGFGSILGKKVKEYYSKGWRIDYIAEVICFAVLVFCAMTFDDNTNMYYGHIFKGVLGLFVAFIGLSMIIILSRQIDKLKLVGFKKALLWCGHNSLVIFGTHLAFKDLFIRQFGDMTLNNPSSYVLGNIVIWGGNINNKID